MKRVRLVLAIVILVVLLVLTSRVKYNQSVVANTFNEITSHVGVEENHKRLPGLKAKNIPNRKDEVKAEYKKITNTEFSTVIDNLERLVHLDLKGAPPKIDYLKKFVPFIKQHGATGILLEYEDMFPFDGNLIETRHGNAYSLEDIATIKQLAKENQLTIMPLVQTYGHLEWLLKVKKFAHLREDARFPQVITPCLDESYTVLFDMLDQVIKQHPDVPYFHIGCDEVYYKLVHQSCTSHDFTHAFMNHLVKIAQHIRTKIPKVKIIFWDDMMHGMTRNKLRSFADKFKEHNIQPMMWGYMQNVESYFSAELFSKYGETFEKIWIATAFKGASGELTTITNIDQRYNNHVAWLNVMLKKVNGGILKFEGVALTGWSRYDHFLALCDLLPQAIPSLAFNLHAIKYGPLSDSDKQQVTASLGCKSPVPWNGDGGRVSCKFPGHEVYEAVLSLPQQIMAYNNAMEFARKYASPINLKYSYLHKKRSQEVLSYLEPVLGSLTRYRNEFVKACDNVYFEETALEWLEVYFDSYYDEVKYIVDTIKSDKQTDWKPRPLAIKLD